MKKHQQSRRKVYIGIDTHLNSYSLVAYDYSAEKFFLEKKIHQPTEEDVLKYVKSVKRQYDEPINIQIGYEAGYVGFTLQRFLKLKHLKCSIIAPHTIKRSAKENKLKTDRRDAKLIAKSLAHHDYSEVYVPSPLDESVRDIIRQRETTVNDLKRKKQQVLAFCARRNLKFKETKTYWTKKHFSWLKSLKFDNSYDQLNFKRMLDSLLYLDKQVKELDKDIKIIANDIAYRSKVRALMLIKGISELIALAIIVEIGDFRRFAKATCFSAFLGLTPAEHASGGKNPDLGITKQGNKFIRKLLVQAAQAYARGNSIAKSKKDLKLELEMPRELVDYADRARERIHSRYIHLSLGLHKPHNKVVCAIARELSCFVWGMMKGETA